MPDVIGIIKDRRLLDGVYGVVASLLAIATAVESESAGNARDAEDDTPPHQPG